MSLREHVSLREHACVSSRGAQSTELVSLYIGYWTLNNYYYYLLRVHNDIVTTIGRGNGAMLVLLDLSAAFDTIDHDNLFYILEKICRNLW